jgi:transcriptional antiterminator RfaH
MWLVLQVPPQRELFASRLLDRLDVPCYVPTIETKARWSDRTKTIAAPLFRGYVFVRAGIGPAFTPPGSLGSLLKQGGAIAQLTDADIEQIRRICEGPMEVELVTEMHKGDRVRIEDGPLAGVEGVLVSEPSGRRLIVAIEAMGKSLSVHIDREDASKCEPSTPSRNRNRNPQQNRAA